MRGNGLERTRSEFRASGYLWKRISNVCMTQARRTRTSFRIQMLHITNGQSVSLDRAGVPGRIIFWVDPLHDGPVPAGLSLEQLSRVRERFLGNVSLAERDDALLRFR